MKVHKDTAKGLNNVPASIPMEMLSEGRAQSAHGQSLARLNERGGLGINEMLYNLGAIDEIRQPEGQDKVDLLNILVDRYYSRKQISNPANIPLRYEILLDSLVSQRNIAMARREILTEVRGEVVTVHKMLEEATLQSLNKQIARLQEVMRNMGHPLDKEMD